ncbi:MAG: response regulator transcription factor, partial [Pseudopedobacter sp.]|nr:response regulator transcription factor [Deinococcales bacterium]
LPHPGGGAGGLLCCAVAPARELFGGLRLEFGDCGVSGLLLEIVQKLELSPKTVRNYLLNIYSKLQVRDRVQAALLARAQSGERWR